MSELPLLITNKTFSVEYGLTYVFSTSDLGASDPDNTADELVYTITALPSYGAIQLDGTDLVVGESFTQAEIDAGLVSYTHDTTPISEDGFSFILSDGTNALPESNFEIDIFPPSTGEFSDQESVAAAEGSIIPLAESQSEETVIFETRILTGTDDIEERASGWHSFNSSDLELVDDSTNQTVGLRFTNIDIPIGATIVNAYIQFQTDEVSLGTASLLIHGEDVDDADPFANIKYNVSARAATDATIAWSPEEWAVKGEADLEQRTPNLAAIIQEIVSRSGWAALADMVFVITGDGRRVAEAFDGDASGAPLLHIEYAPTSSNTAPVITSPAAVSVAENQTLAIDVEASDDDPAGLGFAISGGADAALFAIDTASGLLSFLNPPDFEAPADADANNIYDVQVTVTDAGGLTDTQSIAVTVTDAAENTAPVITSPAAVSVAENQTLAIDVEASDDDPAGLGFAISGGADAALFAIDTASGLLSFLNPPDFEAPADADANNIYDVQVTVTDAGGLTDTQSIAVTVTDAAENSVIFETRILTGTDDIEERASGWHSFNSSDLELVDDSTNQTVGLRFTNIDIPIGATIVNAYIQFQTDEVSLGTASLLIHGEDVDDADPFANIRYNVSSRAATDATIAWSPEEWAVKGEADLEQRTPNLAAIIQEIVSRSGWAALADMVFVITGDGRRVAEAFDGDASGAPLLHIEYAPTSSNTAPVITSPAAVSVAENQTLAIDVEASDDDPAGLGFAISGGADAALFAIDTASGLLSFLNPPDFEAPADADANNIYDVQVTVTDAGGLTDTQSIAVTVTDAAENTAPVITSPAAVSVAENQTLAIDVEASDDDPAGLGFAISGGADAALFAIDTASGLLSFLNPPDFEAPADADANNIYDVQVTVTDAGGLTDTQSIAVTVTDAAENTAPVITSPAAVSVAENQTLAIDVEASDDDPAGLGFAISGGADAALFAIDTASGLLSFLNPPDFEAPADADANNIYDVQVTVTDAGGLTDTQSIAVTVTDAAENTAPVITSPAAVSVAENQTLAIDVEASDDDPAGLGFAISGGADAALFAIDTASGLLSFLNPPDFEAPADADANNIYDVQVTVTDAGGLTDTQSIAVTVTDAAENTAPVITSPAAVSVAENQTLAIDVEASDDDPAGLGFAISGGADAALFAIDTASGLLSFLNPPDFEAPADADANNIYDVQVTVTDAGGLTDTQSIAVTVTDAAENTAPVITSPAAVSVAENQTLAIDVEASDDDPAGLGFAISGGADAALFAIDTASGLLSFLNPPDFEAPADADANNIYDVQVTVTDAGGLTDTQSIAVTVTDAAENTAPVITSPAAVSVAENQTLAIDVEASDDDPAGLGFAISGGADAALFAIDTASGLLSFLNPPDFEAPADADANNIYDVQVTVTDAGGLTDTQSIAVTVTDAAENTAPVITSPAAVSVAENQTLAIDVEASDDDPAGLGFAISGGADAALFAIDTASGLLSFLNPPDFEAPADADANNIYDVQVTVTDAGGLTDTQSIAVTVTDAAENTAPVITSPAAVSVAENQTLAIDVEASDDDPAGLGFAISGGADAALFAIDTASGLLSFLNPPDFEAPADADANNIYDVQVTVTDAGGLTDTQSIAVTVTDAAENTAPVITSPAAVSVAENQTLAIDVEASDDDPAGLGFAISGGADAALFAIDTASGLLSFLNPPDFEAPADADANNIYDVQVTVTDAGGLTDTQSIAVTVTDAAENTAPVITSPAAVSVAENQTLAIDVEASDDDPAGLGFAISGGADAALFAIDTASGLLSFLNPPDFEAPADADANNIYDVQVTVTDAGGLTDTQSIAVTVTDAAENTAPVITSPAAVSVAENQTLAIDVEASDDDPAGLGFAISGGADAALFAIDTASGLLSFLNPPDFEAPADADANNIYDVQVTVTDAGGLTDTQSIAVTVTDAAENTAPVITSPAAVSVAENQTLAIDVEASDDDPAGLGFAISGGADAALFAIDTASGLLSFLNPPDFEAPADADANNIYDVQVTVTDAGGLTDTQSIAVTVTDAAENTAPVITSPAAVSVAENQTLAIDVEASDDDPAGLGFAISGGADAALFAIDTASGLLSFLNPPDFEAPADADANNIYDVQVTVTDAGGLTDTQSIAVTVTDAAENTAPVITSPAAVSVAENQTLAIDVEASDDDPAGLGFAISGGADAALFAIDTASGLLSFLNPPDFEAPADADANNIYDVQVTVTDAGGLTDTQSIAVTVTDAAENTAPVITSPAAVSVAENQTLAIDVEASDDDPAGLGFAISGGADAALFAIDTASGLLSFLNPPDFEAPADADANNIYDVQVTVTDAGGLTDTQSIAVTVTDAAENTAPVITSPAAVSVAENQTLAIDVEASDDDPAGLGFAISGGADAALFAIDTASGLLSFLNPPDFEAPADADANNIYDVQVTVTDAGGLTDTQSIAVTVTDAAENTAPVITSPAAVSVAENQTLAIDVEASDDDPAGLGFAISGGADAALFAIDTASGLLSFLNPPDFEAPADADANNIYDVQVTVTDAGGLTDTQSIAVTVTDAAENTAPVITSPAAVSVAENQTLAIDVEASDDDPAGLGFAISGGADAALFAIDTASGLLSFLNPPDFEAPADADANNIYDVQVTVTDAGGLTDTQSIAVTVTDAAENTAPVITSPAAVSVAENQTLAIDVEASDDDPAGLGFAISGGADAALFAIDTASGLLSFLNPPDFEAPADADANNIYDVQVTVTDAGGLTDTQSIAVTVTDAAENTAPVITSPAAVSVAENQTLAIDVEASDDDPAGLGFAISGGADAALFAIDTASGLLSFLNPPDFEAPADADANNIYDVQVTVTDAGGLTDTQSIAVTVTDAAENTAPVITSPAAVSVAENQTLAIDVEASDDDPAGLGFAISGGADAALFAIDTASGLLSFLNPPDFEAPADADANNIYDVQVTVTDAGGLTDTQSIAVTVTDAAENSVIFETRILTGTDDIEERASGWHSFNSSDLELVDDSTNQTVGLRFTNIDIPIGATIVNAYIQFQTDEVSLGTASLLIHGEDVDDADPFANIRYNVSSRAATDATIAWSPEEWAVKGEADLEQRTPNLAAIIQEIVSRSGWAALADMVFVITGDGRRVAEAFDGDASGAPLLHIEYAPTAGNAERVTFDAIPDADAQNNQVGELAAVGTTIGITASAFDPTVGDSVTYSIDDDRFTINPVTGVLSRSGVGTLDFETQPLIQLTVTAASSDGTIDARTFVVNILDDPEPVEFGQPPDVDPAFDRVAEDAPSDALIGITASAFDVGDTVAYTVADIRFQVDSVTGVISRSSQGTIDYTTEPVVALDVTASSSDGSSAVQTFMIDVVPAATTTIMKFAAFGDWGELDFSGEEAVAAMVDSWNVDFIIALGDYSYEDPIPLDDTVGAFYADYIGNYAGAYGSGAVINQFFPALGNHEYTNDPAGLNNGIDIYLDYFTLPDNERYYDFRVGDVHFFALNSNWREPDGEESDSIQAQWYENAVLASDADVKITFFHHSPYTGGTKDSEFMRWDFEDLGIDAVFAGHDHIYARVNRDDDGDGTELPYVTSGLGGADFDPPDVGANLVTVTDFGTIIEFYTVDGILRDSYIVETTNGNALSEHDLLIGSSDEDYLWGLTGNDTLNGAEADDFLIGGPGDDVFVFNGAVGHDVVQDFSPGAGTEDQLDLEAFGIDSLSDFSSVAHDEGGNVIADLTTTDTLTLIGVQLTEMSDDDFIITLIA